MVWKELLDLGRDRRTLFSVVLLPLLLLPLLGAFTVYFTKQQPVGIALVDEESTSVSKSFISKLEAWIKAYSAAYKQLCTIKHVSTRDEALRDPSIDYVVIVPRGFSSNITSVDRVAILITEKRIDTARSQMAETIVVSSIKGLQRDYAMLRIKELSRKAGVKLNPDAVLEPVRIEKQTYATGGRPAPPSEEYMFYTIRMLSFALLFVVTPSVTYVTDSIMGEKERKTLEALLATPVSYETLLAGKLVASSVIGIIAGVADVGGVITYFYILERWGEGMTLLFTKELILLHSLDVALTVFATSALVTPLVVRSGSVRAANIISSGVVGAATIVFFGALFTDIPRLPVPVYYPMLALPYTHSVLILYYYAQHFYTKVMIHLLALIACSGVLYAISFKTFNTEKILTSNGT